MRWTAWYRAAREFSGPTWICPIPKVLKRSRRAAQGHWLRSFDVLHLLTQFFNLRANFQGKSGDGQGFGFHTGSLGKHGVGFAMHFLEQKIELLAELAGTVEEFRELLEVAAQTI